MSVDMRTDLILSDDDAPHSPLPCTRAVEENDSVVNVCEGIPT